MFQGETMNEHRGARSDVISLDIRHVWHRRGFLGMHGCGRDVSQSPKTNCPESHVFLSFLSQFLLHFDVRTETKTLVSIASSSETVNTNNFKALTYQDIQNTCRLQAGGVAATQCYAPHRGKTQRQGSFQALVPGFYAMIGTHAPIDSASSPWLVSHIFFTCEAQSNSRDRDNESIVESCTDMCQSVAGQY